MDQERRTRNPNKDEYEVEIRGAFVYVGVTEETAIKKAQEILADQQIDTLRMYHTHPSPGPMRRYAGKVAADGLHRARP